MNCICAKTRRAARAVSALYEERLRPSGLTPGQFELLSELAAKPGRSQAQLTTDMGLDQTTLSRNLRMLASHGWVSAAPSPVDGRLSLHSLTAEGKQRLALALPYWQDAHHELQRQLSSAWEETWTALDRLSHVLSA